MAANSGELLSRIATGDGHGENSSYFDGWKAYDMNPFDLHHNRDGVIQMGLAENQLSLDLLEEWSLNHPEASICTAQGASQFRRIANFQDYHGLPEFREAMAKFMGQVRGGKVTFDADRVVMCGGATGAQDTLAFCLADPGDAYLVPTPYYPAFDRDCCWRSGVKLLPIECHSSNGFALTREALVSAYDGARSQGIRVKGILITNPSNPLGTIMGRATLAMLAEFATERRVHLISDEIYAGSVFAKPDFVSIAEVVERDVPGCDRDLVHIAYSLSKDFGLPGFRVGIIYSYNDAVVACARKMSSFGLVSSQTQYFLAKMLSDHEFMARFLAESKRRLAARHDRFTSGLREVGIGCLHGNAGLFSWMDLRGMLREKTPEAELELWRVIIHKVKLNVSPGTSFHCDEPGWFRVCHANMDDATMEVALDRIRCFVRKHHHQQQQQKAKAKLWAARGPLHLSLPRRGGAAASHLALSSPLALLSPQSPMVHAS
ncbi:1-aminocyclopropane-1-carboxylate synthase [Dichanthelium oligosanthes]|uniref:1-aminocyclopropane-1-carboxylate synthase n=1 Tax=Dichanthelium oligosanthes TaxID=888268 RepID=A0A1E5WIR6_9POAL|nr:1-aminocyclopropane-1-carboxylate synthase [Dichanthelium oligosanthes]